MIKEEDRRWREQNWKTRWNGKQKERKKKTTNKIRI